VVPPVELDTSYARTNFQVRYKNFTWQMVDSTNYVEFVNNLRVIGCPEGTIRDLLVSDIGRIYSRRKLAEVVYPNYQWWRSDPDPEAERAAAAKMQSLDAERRSLLTSLLGTNWEVETKEAIAARGGITLTGPILGDMTNQTKQAALDIIVAAQQKIDAYQEQQRLLGSPVDPMQMVRLREEPLAPLAAIMTQEEYGEFALRYSPAAQQLRERMRGVNLAPAQFSDLFNALNGILGQPAFYYAGTDAPLLKQQQQLQAQSEAVIKETLGAPAYSALQLTQDPLYRSAQAVAQQLNIPASSIMPVYEINRATQAEMTRIRNDASLSNDEKVEALSQTQVEQQQTLQQILGPEAFQRWLASQGLAR
jgi:plasmid stability protein